MTTIKHKEKKLGRPRKGVRKETPKEFKPNCKIMQSKYDGWCGKCKSKISAGQEITYYFDTRKAEHVICPTAAKAATPAPKSPVSKPKVNKEESITYSTHCPSCKGKFKQGDELVVSGGGLKHKTCKQGWNPYEDEPPF